ncbi:hypothetical protein [Pseudomonas sp. ICMP 561]|uniref:hypothetical protein n=1 Tax=Pseudomonas sp. ICMP 561 TaxID=1718918 RepID=UPI000C06B886|nr:hypothetical protein [Pseudomonas sp. ICMP 561]PHN33537.1 hypothetical protein AO242_22890 [Pseudomonas sp. ICMP 561]
MIWLEIENPEGKKIPKWMRTLGVSEDHSIFVPAAIGGNEMSVSLCTAYDGTAMVTYRNRVFVPSTWMSKEFPDTRELCEVMDNWANAQIAAGILEDPSTTPPNR